MFCSGLAISVNLETNLLTKFIFPKNECMDFLLWGYESCSMVLTLLGSMIIYSLEMICLINFPSITTKLLFLGFKEVIFPTSFKNLC